MDEALAGGRKAVVAAGFLSRREAIPKTRPNRKPNSQGDSGNEKAQCSRPHLRGRCVAEVRGPRAETCGLVAVLTQLNPPSESPIHSSRIGEHKRKTDDHDDQHAP